jgi:hypothetical protein
MPLYRTVFNGSRTVQRQVKKKKEQPTPNMEPERQTGGAITQLKSMPGPPKEQDKKAIRLKMAQELMKNL